SPAAPISIEPARNTLGIPASGGSGARGLRIWAKADLQRHGRAPDGVRLLVELGEVRDLILLAQPEPLPQRRVRRAGRGDFLGVVRLRAGRPRGDGVGGGPVQA